MIEHLRVRDERFVINNELVVREEPMLYSPNFPEDERTKQELLRDWKDLYKGPDDSNIHTKQ